MNTNRCLATRNDNPSDPVLEECSSNTTCHKIVIN